MKTYITIKASSIHNVHFPFLFYSLYSLSWHLARAVDLLFHLLTRGTPVYKGTGIRSTNIRQCKTQTSDILAAEAY